MNERGYAKKSPEIRGIEGEKMDQFFFFFFWVRFSGLHP